MLSLACYFLCDFFLTYILLPAPEDSPDLMAPASVLQNPRDIKVCVMGHTHDLTLSQGRNWFCDGCHVQPPAGACALTCMACNFDLCFGCVFGLQFPVLNIDELLSRRLPDGSFPVHAWALLTPDACVLCNDSTAKRRQAQFRVDIGRPAMFSARADALGLKSLDPATRNKVRSKPSRLWLGH
jgi:hypothetical protein